ncbi:hypothetical protein TanjilG_11691 [Lupinus angustifolius]|uniref:Protein Mpv17 n=1 Tax=Lupinus angustifolius TaxID=3871 RepID=A0A1J7H093_LUPAN|nr:hypothetical protein TanjilG_11691 [Lupinus angustifolius]
MNAIGGFWNWNPLLGKSKPSVRRRINSNSGSTGEGGYHFPLKQAFTAASLALTGDTIAQLRDRWSKAKADSKNRSVSDEDTDTTQDILWNQLSDHDWLRALRMTSYGFLFYGPGSYSWYQCLDHFLPKATVQNVMLKVLLNQIVLGPCVIAVVFAWNNLWLKKLPELPGKYKRDALPTLLYGFRFWIPVSVINFCCIHKQCLTFYEVKLLKWINQQSIGLGLRKIKEKCQ